MKLTALRGQLLRCADTSLLAVGTARKESAMLCPRVIVPVKGHKHALFLRHISEAKPNTSGGDHNRADVHVGHWVTVDLAFEALLVLIDAANEGESK